MDENQVNLDNNNIQPLFGPYAAQTLCFNKYCQTPAWILKDYVH